MKKQLLVIAVVIAAIIPAAGAGDSAVVQVHIPREAVVEAKALLLGTFAIVRCEDEALQDKVSGIAMGRAPWAGETIQLDRATILSRVASIGLTKDQIQLSGAERITITRDERVIAQERVITAARSYLQETHSTEDGRFWTVVNRPEEIFAPTDSVVELKAELVEEPAGRHINVRVIAYHEGKPVGETVLRFKQVYSVCRAVATADIRVGERITEGNTELSEQYVATREAAQWVSPIGQLAKRTIPAGTMIHPGMVRDIEMPLLIRRGQSVVMQVEGPGFIISAIAEALQDGKHADIIRVRNVDSGQIVRVEVMADRTVRPFLAEDELASAQPAD